MGKWINGRWLPSKAVIDPHLVIDFSLNSVHSSLFRTLMSVKRKDVFQE